MTDPTQTLKGAVLLDDGAFSIELDPHHAERESKGYLNRRCYYGVTTPDGYECVGGFHELPDGRWRVVVQAAYDPVTDTDAKEIGNYKGRVYAIVALWQARHQAYCRHAD